MNIDDIEALAEDLLTLHGATADMEALKRADSMRFLGDIASSQKWILVTDRVREMQNIRHVHRCV